jgi:hypothetical protein
VTFWVANFSGTAAVALMARCSRFPFPSPTKPRVVWSVLVVWRRCLGAAATNPELSGPSLGGAPNTGRRNQTGPEFPRNLEHGTSESGTGTGKVHTVCT